MRVDRGRDIGRLAVHCSVCGSVRIQFARTWRCMNWTLLQQMSEKTVYVLIPNLTENPIIESEKYKFPGMRASHPRRKKAGLTSKKRSVWRAEGKSEDIQMAGRCFTDTFIVRFPARHFSDDKCVGRSFEEALPCPFWTRVLTETEGWSLSTYSNSNSNSLKKSSRPNISLYICKYFQPNQYNAHICWHEHEAKGRGFEVQITFSLLHLSNFEPEMCVCRLKAKLWHWRCILWFFWDAAAFALCAGFALILSCWSNKVKLDILSSVKKC